LIAWGRSGEGGGAPHAAPVAVRRPLRTLALPLALGLALAACESFEPYEYQPSSEIPKGSGILSGDDGEYVIYRE